MNKNCLSCQTNFEITDEDLSFYEEVSPLIAGKKILIPPPKTCPDCRQQRRLCFRNERNLYHRECDIDGKKIISVYSKDKPYKVYDVDAWYSDKLDPISYGVDYDFSRSFFSQFDDLLHLVPHLSRSVTKNENSDFINQAGWCKNCYLIFEADYNQDCYYSSHLTDSVNSLDLLYCDKMELCYECINCQKSYNLKYSENCANCSDSSFLKDCIGCSDCIMCVTLRNKKYCIYNQQYSKEEYGQKKKDFQLTSNSQIKVLGKDFETFKSKFPNKYMQGVSNLDCTGNYISNSKNCHNCFDVLSSEDSKYLVDCRNTKKSYDITVFGSQRGINFSLDCHEIGDAVSNIYFSDQVWNGCNNIFYSKTCINNCSNLFGCVGLKQKQYCILNKQFTKEDYEELVPRIIEHMTMNRSEATGSWGEFFPKELSQFGYNETLAQEYYELNKEEALERGFKWSDAENMNTVHAVSNYEIEDDVFDVSEDICSKVLNCENSNKPFKIISQELAFYKRMGIAIPRISHNERHFLRMKKKSSRKLVNCSCTRCGVEIVTSEDRRNVHCEKCFEEMVD